MWPYVKLGIVQLKICRRRCHKYLSCQVISISISDAEYRGYFSIRIANNYVKKSIDFNAFIALSAKNTTIFSFSLKIPLRKLIIITKFVC